MKQSRMSLKCSYEGNAPIKDRKSSALYKILSEKGAHTESIKKYTDFVEDIAGRTISPNKSIVLVKLKDGSELDVLKLRLMLKDIRIIVHYHDMYNNSFRRERKLDFYGRHCIVS